METTEPKETKDAATEASLKKEVRERTIGYIVASFGLVAGLAWNDAIKTLIEYIFPLGQNTLFAKFFYAILITLVIVFITEHLMSFTNKDQDK